MRVALSRIVAGLVLLAAFAPRFLRAEDAVLVDGRRVHGRLSLTGGRLEFTAAGQRTTAPWERIDRVRFPAADLPPLRALTLHRVELPDDQRLTGEFLGLDAREVRFRTAWADRLTVPRSAVLGLTHAPGFVPVFGDDFEAGLKAWSLTGEPELTDREHTSGRHGLQFARPGQAAEYTPPDALEAGGIGVNFLEVGSTTEARWLVEAEFGGTSGPRRVRAVLAGPGAHYRADVPDAPGLSERVPRTPGWHRLQLEFGPSLLSVTIDDAVLYFSRRHGPAGPLRNVRLACVAVAGAGPPRGAVVFDDFCLARAVDELRHRHADLHQDDLWLLWGDQLLGEVVGADRRAIELHGRFGTRSFGWSEVRGLFPRQQSVPPRVSEGEHLRLWLRTGVGSDVDSIEGTVQALDARRLTLRHLVLGDLAIDRGRLRRLRRLFYGERVVVDPGLHHLGPPGKLMSTLQPPRPDGVSLRWAFPLSAAPRDARLVLHVTQLKGPGDGIGPALERGGLRTEVVVNGRVVDYLNRHVERAGREPRRLRLALPADSLRAGDNVLELRLTPDRDSGRYEHCGVSLVTVEVPR